jgi:hypothetical protein
MRGVGLMDAVVVVVSDYEDVEHYHNHLDHHHHHCYHHYYYIYRLGRSVS